LCETLEIEKLVEEAWLGTVGDFEEAQKSGEAGLWTEATLRLNFLRRLCEIAKLDRILAETPYHLGYDDYKPDIIAEVIIDGAKRVVFEIKFFGQTKNWKKDLKKLQKYSFIGWDYGYFLAIGSHQQCDEIMKESIQEPTWQYNIRILTHSARKIKEVMDFKFAALVLEKSLGKDIPYIPNEFIGAIAYYEKYLLYFDISVKEDKLVLWANVNGTAEEQKINEFGYPYVTFDDEGEMHPSATFTGNLLIGEFEYRGRTVEEVVENIKERLYRFNENIKLLYESKTCLEKQ